jgi:hypothetical protein
MHVLGLRALSSLLIGVSAASANAASSGEVLFAELRHEVEVLRPQQTADKAERIAKSTANLTECPIDAVHASEDGTLRTSLAFGQGGVQKFNALYTYADLYFENDYCIYLLRPVRRALTLEEARDFAASLLIKMPITQALIPRETPESKAVAAQAFDELRDAVHSGKAEPIDPHIPPYAGMENLTDCSKTPVEVLRRALTGGSTGYIYNAAYSWAEVDSGNGRSCIYLERPLNRGLTVEEARDFLAATRLGMGLLEPPRHENAGEEDPAEWIQAEPGSHPPVPAWASKDDYPFEITITPENEPALQKKRVKKAKPF